MKIVCLIGDAPPLIWFANRIHRAAGIDLAVVEKGRAPQPQQGGGGGLVARLLEKGRAEGSGAVLEAAAKTVAAPIKPLVQSAWERERPARMRRAWESVLGEGWASLDPTIDVLEVESVNAPEVKERLAALKPDLLLDHGTGLVKDAILEEAVLALNLHWGLSPAYRGSNCTEWALLNGDPFGIGVTIHKLSRAIDGGDVLAQTRPAIDPGDTAYDLNMKLTRAGTELILEAIEKRRAGEALAFTTQDRNRGRLYRIADWGRAERKALARIEREGRLKQMLEDQAP